MSYFMHLSKAERDEAVARGVIRAAAKYSGVHKSTVSRTFAGKIKHPNLDVVKEIQIALARIKRAMRSVA